MSPKRAVEYWIEVGDKYLADGEWHNGFDYVERMRIAIPPGVAIRRAEANRASASGTDTRVEQASENRLISIGRRSIITQFLHGRVRFGILEIKPWPIPAESWRSGDWRVRDLRPSWITVPELANQYHVRGECIREMIKQEPQLGHVMRGRWMYLLKTEIPALETRIKRYNLESRQLRGDSARRHRKRLAQMECTELSVRQLACRSAIAPTTASKLRLDNPQLPWIEHGVHRHALPVAALPAWDLVVNIYRRGVTPRRTQAMTEGRRRKKRA